MKRYLIAFAALAVVVCGAAQAQYTPWLYWTFLPQEQMDVIVGEASGETAWRTIATINSYNRPRTDEEFKGNFFETRYVLDQLKAYGLTNAEVVTYPGGDGWLALKGDLWENKPIRQKLASYDDNVPMLAFGSSSADVTARARLGRPRHSRGDQGGERRRKDRRHRGEHGLRPRRSLPTAGGAGRDHRRREPRRRRRVRDALEQHRAQVVPGPARRSGPAGGEAVRRAAQAEVRVQPPRPRGGFPQAPARLGPKDHGQRQGRDQGPSLRHGERHRLDPGKRPRRGRDHLLGPPVRGDRQAGRQRQHLRERRDPRGGARPPGR